MTLFELYIISTHGEILKADSKAGKGKGSKQRTGANLNQTLKPYLHVNDVEMSIFSP